MLSSTPVGWVSLSPGFQCLKVCTLHTVIVGTLSAHGIGQDSYSCIILIIIRQGARDRFKSYYLNFWRRLEKETLCVEPLSDGEVSFVKFQTICFEEFFCFAPRSSVLPRARTAVVGGIVIAIIFLVVVGARLALCMLEEFWVYGWQ